MQAYTKESPFALGGDTDGDFLMGGSVASCDASIQLGFLRKVRRQPSLPAASPRRARGAAG